MNRKRMPRSHMNILRRNYSLLLDEIDAMVLVPKLIELDVITWDDKEAIRLQAYNQGTKAGTDKLLDILFRSGNNAYKGFMESLSIKGYHHVVRQLEQDVNNLSSETVDDSKRVDDLLSKYKTQQQTINKQQQDINYLTQTINKQQQGINSLTQSNNQLNGEVQSLKQQLGTQQTEKPNNSEKDMRPIPWEKMSAEEKAREALRRRLWKFMVDEQ